MKYTDVLIVGGGPIGLFLAYSLDKMGINSVLINDRKQTTTHPKLDVVNCRTMEIFRQFGLSDDVRSKGNPLDSNQYVAFAASVIGPYYSLLDNQHIVYQPVSKSRRAIETNINGTLPLESMQRIPQMHLEPILLDAVLRSKNSEARFGWKLINYDQDDSEVSALIKNVDSDENQQIRAKYLIGCDGPNSHVRSSLNINYDGTMDILGELYIIHFKSQELRNLFPKNEPYWHTWLCKPGFNGLLVSPNASKDDFVLHRPFAPRKGETIEELIDKAVGKKIKYELVQSGPWRPQFLVATQFGRKRVFIAGDATHRYMPTGGLGMNVGICEAHNLAWKLNAMIKGWGGRHLMDSYEKERLPVAIRNREHVKKCAAAVFESQFASNEHTLEDNDTGKEVRNKLKKDFENKIPRLYESLGIEMGYRYHLSNIIYKDLENEPEYSERNYIPTTFSGGRLPNIFLKDGRAILDLIDFQGFTLFNMSENSRNEKLINIFEKLKIPFQIIQVLDSDAIKLFEKEYILVRPDQHICFRGDSLPEDCESLVSRIIGELN